MKKKSKLKQLFNSFPSDVSLPFHQACLIETSPRRFKWKNIETKKFLKKFEDDFGFVPQPQRFSLICINWSEKGRGFGEYLFWQDGDKIYCRNEFDSKETVKRILCQMVDQSIFTETNEKDPTEIDLFKVAVEVLESKKRAKEWLSTKKVVFGNKTPLEYAKKFGYSEVIKALKRLEQGIPS